MRVLVREVREGIIDLVPSNYRVEDTTFERIIEVEGESSLNTPEYMDILDTSSVITFKKII